MCIRDSLEDRARSGPESAPAPILRRRARRRPAQQGGRPRFGRHRVPVSYTHLDVYKRQVQVVRNHLGHQLDIGFLVVDDDDRPADWGAFFPDGFHDGDSGAPSSVLRLSAKCNE